MEKVNGNVRSKFLRNLSHRPIMSLGEYYILCAKCSFKDMKAECIRAQSLDTMGCLVSNHHKVFKL